MYNHHGIKLLIRLRVGLRHLRESIFWHNFQDSLDPFCNCGRHIETTIHFFLHYLNCSNKKKVFLKRLLPSNVLYWTNYSRNSPFWIKRHQWQRKCMESTIEYIITTGRFTTPLLWIHLSKSTLLLKTLIDSGSPYVILFCCLVVKLFLYMCYF